MPELPELLAPTRVAPAARVGHASTAISLKGLDYQKARAIPGAIYDPGERAMVLPVVTPRAAIVALTLFPGLGSDYPELIEARDTLLADVRPTDYATAMGLPIEAPDVHASLLADGHDWLEFEDEVPGEWPNSSLPDPGPRRATQSTDLGYAAAILRKHGAFYLGWARGYGKTLGTCAIIEANEYSSVLIAVPNTAKQDVWVREIYKRLPSHAIIVYPDSSRSNYKANQLGALELAKVYHAEGKPFVFIIHHEGMKSVADRTVKSQPRAGWKRLGIEWDLFAFDEAHKLKSAGRKGSIVHKVSCKVPSRARLALSGSVYENNWEEPYGVFHWLYPNQYAVKTDWTGRYLDYVEGAGGYGKICVGILPGKEQQLRDEIGVFLIVREKPDKSIRLERMVDLSPTQRKAYDELQADFFTQLEDGTAVLAQAGVVMLTRLRQIASGLELLTGKVADSSKLDAAMQAISDYEDFDDFFVACWYKASAYALVDRLVDAGYEHIWTITGDVPMTRRNEILDATRDATARARHKPVILIGTIPTLGESSNLQHLNHVIRIDRSFNPALNRQVVDRCDRTGQKRKVRLTDIIARDTVDELVVMPNLANKDAFRAMVLGRIA